MFGVLLAALFAWQLHYDGRLRMRNVMLALALVAVASLATGYGAWVASR
jgi:hypothetical protein